MNAEIKILLAVIGLIFTFAFVMFFNTYALAAPAQVVISPSTIGQLDAAKELKKACQCKCKRRSNMTDLMDVKELLDEKLQEIEVQPEQKLN